MSVYIGAGTLAPPDDPTTTPRRTAAQHLWFPDDGSGPWTLSDRQSGVYLGPGVVGLTTPDADFYVDESAGVDGGVDTGMRLPPRDVLWPLRVRTTGESKTWYDLDSAFWETLALGRSGRWEVTAPNGTVRSLRVRVVNDGQGGIDTDPGLNGWLPYAVRLVALDPYWRGPDLVQEWDNGTGGHPMFNRGLGLWIRGSRRANTATITNPGQVQTYVTWEIFGATTSVDVGVGGLVDQLHFPIASDKAVIFDTRPTVASAYDATVVLDDAGRKVAVKSVPEVDLSPLIGTYNGAPIPPGQSLPLSLTITGTGSVRATISPAYYRAW